MQSRLALKYDVMDMIGMGTQAKIHHCMDRATGEELVVKMIYYGDIDRDSKEYYGMSREGYLMQAFDHPYILPVREVIIDSRMQTIYIIMPRMKYSLKKLIQNHRKRRENILEQDIWKYTYQLLNALHYLHDPSTEAWYMIPELLSRSTSRRSSVANDQPADVDDQGPMENGRIHFPIPHRDIKPDNILIDSKDDIKLADFTMAAQFDEEELKQLKNVIFDYVNNTEEQGFAGAPGYRAPEAYYSVAGVENDIWALGCVVYEMATTELLFPTSNVQDAYFSGKNRFGIHLPGRSQDLVKLVEAMLTINPAKRPRAVQLLRHPRFREYLTDSLKNEIFIPNDIACRLIYKVTDCNELEQLLCSLSWSGGLDESSMNYLFTALQTKTPVDSMIKVPEGPLGESTAATVGTTRTCSDFLPSTSNSVHDLDQELESAGSPLMIKRMFKSNKLANEPISPSRGYILYNNISAERYSKRHMISEESSVDPRRAQSAMSVPLQRTNPAPSLGIVQLNSHSATERSIGNEEFSKLDLQGDLQQTSQARFDTFCTITELREMQNLKDLRDMPKERAAQRSQSAYCTIKDNVRAFSYPSPARLQSDYNEKYDSVKWNPKGFSSLRHADAVSHCVEKLRQINRTCQHVRSNSPVNSYGRTASADTDKLSIAIPRRSFKQGRLS